MTPNSVMGASARMHILHVAPCYAPAWAYGHVPHAVAALARAQVALGHDVTVLTSDAVAPHERLPAGERSVDGVRIVRFRNLSGLVRSWLNLSTPVGLRSLARALLAGEADVAVLHLHELQTVENLILLGALGATPAVVASTHGTLARNEGARSMRVWDWGLRARHLGRIDRFIADSAAEADEIRGVCTRRGVTLDTEQVSVLVEPGAPLALATAMERVYDEAVRANVAASRRV
jgi:hypothetical protein